LLVLVEIDVHSACPKELTICRNNGAFINVGVGYPWLPPKCFTCGHFGHATYACAKKEKQVWIPKNPKNVPKKKSSPAVKPVVFDKAIKRPVGGDNTKRISNGLWVSNTFESIGNLDQEVGKDEEFRVRSPTTFLEVFEQALSSRDKGKGKMSGRPFVEKGLSPNCVS
jgi:hypothetical protein